MSVDHGFAPGARPYIFQEVIDYGGEAISKYEYSPLGAVTEFRYGKEVSNAMLRRNELRWFSNWGEAWSLLPSHDALVFIDNHDTQRSSGDIPLTYKNSKLYKVRESSLASRLPVESIFKSQIKFFVSIFRKKDYDLLKIFSKLGQNKMYFHTDRYIESLGIIDETDKSQFRY